MMATRNHLRHRHHRRHFGRVVAAGRAARFLVVLCTVWLIGCAAEPPQFRPNLVDLKIEEMQSEKIPDEQLQKISDILLALFGTPDDPTPFHDPQGGKAPLLKSFGFDVAKLKVAAGPVYDDPQTGRQRGLYRLHCAHCHGITGDGAGPTAAFLNPYPRDYRQGRFKFKSTLGDAKPTHADLMLTLEDGVPGTSMPSFRILPEDERNVLAEYVRYLSVRGQTELELIKMAARGDELPEPAVLAGGFPLSADDEGNIESPAEENVVAAVVYTWREAPRQVIDPAADPAPLPVAASDSEAQKLHAASIDRGRTLFYSKVANCFSCHGDSQLGDGQTNDYDYWFQWRKNLDQRPEPERQKLIDEFLALGALPPRHIIPRNLRAGVYRGGRRPMDLYRRIYSGINGTPMPAVAKAQPGADGAAPDPAQGLTDDQIWDLVHYVKSLPFEPLSQPPKALEALRKQQL